jgi:hypothetical protein
MPRLSTLVVALLLAGVESRSPHSQRGRLPLAVVVSSLVHIRGE